jgi:peroxiredoxin family protein
MTGYAIVLASGELERVQAVSTISSIAAASGIPIDVFVTMNGLLPFEDGAVAAGNVEAGPVGQAMLDSKDDEVPLFTEQFAEAKEIGELTVYGCTLAMDLLDWELADLDDVVDETLGVAGFLNKAADKEIIFV